MLRWAYLFCLSACCSECLGYCLSHVSIQCPAWNARFHLVSSSAFLHSMVHLVRTHFRSHGGRTRSVMNFTRLCSSGYPGTATGPKSFPGYPSTFGYFDLVCYLSTAKWKCDRNPSNPCKCIKFSSVPFLATLHTFWERPFWGDDLPNFCVTESKFSMFCFPYSVVLMTASDCPSHLVARHRKL